MSSARCRACCSWPRGERRPRPAHDQHDHEHPHRHGHVADGWMVHDYGGGAQAHAISGADVTPRTLVVMGLAGGPEPSPPRGWCCSVPSRSDGRAGRGGDARRQRVLLVRFGEGAERVLTRRRRPRVERAITATPRDDRGRDDHRRVVRRGAQHPAVGVRGS